MKVHQKVNIGIRTTTHIIFYLEIVLSKLIYNVDIVWVIKVQNEIILRFIEDNRTDVGTAEKRCDIVVVVDAEKVILKTQLAVVVDVTVKVL